MPGDGTIHCGVMFYSLTISLCNWNKFPVSNGILSCTTQTKS